LSGEAPRRVPAVSPSPPAPVSWANLGALSAVHLVGLGGGALYVVFHGLTLSALIITLVGIQVTILAISAGYHRLFSHRTYEPHPVVEFFLLCFGAAAF
jgi:stearoyl-CoA desaturase (delta-9 desaturase)